MSEIKIKYITSRDEKSGPTIAGVSTVSGSFMIIPSGDTAIRSAGSGKGVFASGATPSATNVLDIITIATTGNAVDFGDDTVAREEGYATGASSTRGILAGGYVSPDAIKTISYFTFSSGGFAGFFGDTFKMSSMACSLTTLITRLLAFSRT